ncbi:hypothetical protein C0Q70_09159 [Pomacea canaliculata]|uniref:G-protein coupled receptors family 1 profile domain-containing protein n=1 Tax=Pomacea canaliculata TaxID=400727 RepID=A0A2T7P904_POMCA|nr:D(2) dopamine receptor-like [Pomacea canaliculata]PVD29902.1 hypothetical protein C0Q70_09159 [Pomacea canaliculata]
MNNTSDNETDYYAFYDKIQTMYYASYIWVLAAFGVPGNVACILTVATMTMTTATVYVVLLAAADLAALVLKLIYHQIYYHEVPVNTFICKGDVVVQVVSCYANWTLVLICFERFLGVCYPLKRNAYFTTKKAIVIAVLLGLTLCLCFLYGFVQMDKTEEGYCYVPEYAREFHTTYWYWIIASIYFFLPFILISIFTGLIIVSLRRQRKARETIRVTAQSTSGKTTEARVEQTICIMMLCAAIVFLLLILPTCIYHSIAPLEILKDDTPEKFFASSMFQYLAISLSEANHAVNFYIYFLSAKRFRFRFRDLMGKCFPFLRRRAHENIYKGYTSKTQSSVLHESNINVKIV